MKSVKIATMMLLAMVLPACSDSDDGDGENNLQPRVEITLTRSESVTMTKQNNLGFKMLRTVMDNSTNTNVAISPYSMSQTLAMLANGAKGEVLNEIVALLSDAGTSIDEINGYYKKLNEGFAKTDKTTKIEMVNGLWAAKDIQFVPDFEKVNSTYYGAIVQSFDRYGDVVSYYKKNMSENISSAVAEALKNMTDEYVKDFSLNNTTYFKGIWKNKFNVENTSSQPFYGENGAGVAKMMSRSLRCPLYVGKCSEAVQLDYGNGAFSMMVVLPNEDSSINEALNELCEGGFSPMTCNDNVFVQLKLPRFGYEDNFNMLDVLTTLGIKHLKTGNYTGITGNAAVVDGVNQYMKVTVDEEGTVVKTSTTIGGITDVSPDKQFEVNRPFIWVIKENTTGAILFAGKQGTV
ncbi:MAG: serpin family protein [Muribaculaceae bacterium]